jgi:hypothetical protein
MNRHPRRVFLAALAGSATSLAVASAQKREPAGDIGTHSKRSRCGILPLPDDQTAFECGGREVLRWHFGAHYPRPFFYPFVGPSGVSLTRMGHPGAPDHDHHRSIWFAHRDVAGSDFWSDNTEYRIRQKQWLCYEEGDAQAMMAVRLGWYAGTPARELMEQTLVAILRPLEHGEQTLELQSTFVPTTEAIRLGKTNFGFLAVRVARSISEYFGGGRLSDSQGRETEAAIFGQRASWVDYSGTIRGATVEGITYFDHPDNPGFPSKWHVREDGWMGASLCMDEERTLEPGQPLRLRYLLHAHRGGNDGARAARIAEEFARAPLFTVTPSKAKHRQFELKPADSFLD